MAKTKAPKAEDDLDKALGKILEYLALSGMVEGELNVVGPAINKVIVALLVSQEAQGKLSPYRERLLQRIRAGASGGKKAG